MASLKDLSERVKQLFSTAGSNLSSWKQVATTPQLRQDYSKYVVQPAQQKLENSTYGKVASKVNQYNPFSYVQAMQTGLAKQVAKPIASYGKFIGTGLIQAPLLAATKGRVNVPFSSEQELQDLYKTTTLPGGKQLSPNQSMALRGAGKTAMAGLTASTALNPMSYMYRAFPAIYGAGGSAKDVENAVADFAGPSRLISKLKPGFEQTKTGQTLDTVEMIAGLLLNRGVDDMAIKALLGNKASKVITKISAKTPMVFKPKDYLTQEEVNIVDDIITAVSKNKDITFGDNNFIDNILTSKTGAKLEKLEEMTLNQKLNEIAKFANISSDYLAKSQERFRKIKLPGMGFAEQPTKPPRGGVGVSPEVKPDKFVQEMDEMVKNSVPPKPTKPLVKISASEGQEKLTGAVMGEEEGVFKNVFDKWIGQREVAKTTGAEAGYNFRDIPKEKATEFINQAEGVATSNDPEIVAKAMEWKQTTDKLYGDLQSVAKKEGVDLGYIDQYVTHFWKQSPEEVQRILSAKGRNFGSRKVPTYAEGIELGLTPKYANPAEIMSEYVNKIEKTKANIGLFSEMKKRNLIVPSSIGRDTPGFSPVNAPGFPRSTTGYEGKVFDGSYYAPTSIAREINRIFSPEDFGKLGKGFRITAKISKGTQDVVLSGGLPGTPINAFTAAQTVKEFTSGSFVRPIKAFAVSLNPKASMEYFKNNAEQIKKMQARNVTVRSSFNTQGLMGGGNTWDKVVSDPTFKRFMPTLQIELFNNVEKKALGMGKQAEEAADIAAKAVSNFYGMTNTGTAASRSNLGRDITSTVAFAPTYRESMINMWVNSVKALGKPLALENRQNIKFLIGAVATYGAMNYLNEKLNGHPMSQNPKGKEDKLLIPAGDTTIGIPFLSSIATVPRGIYRIVKDVLDVDFKAAGADTLRTFGSMLIKPAGEMILNEDYFGQEIYDPDADRLEKGKQIASYLFKSNQHPYVKAALEAKGTPVYQTLSKAGELPFRFYKTSSIANAPFWDNYFATKKLDEQFQELKYKDPDKAVEFYNANKPQLDSLKLLKEKISAYYETGKDSSVLQEGGVVQGDGHMAFTGTDGKFHLIDTNFDVPIPEFTGNELLDKKIRSSYTSKLTSLATNVVTLFENGIITADQAEEALGGIEELKLKVKITKAKAAKKITSSKITMPKFKVSAPKTSNIKIKAPPKPKKIAIAKNTIKVKNVTYKINKPSKVKLIVAKKGFLG